ncbi:histidine--tRNA ligase [Thermoflavimicrobium dichotomicum]|uniref:Histidine--tRNA ligase n=1 Tax=Thermoflavimicrobium dichotomicum TaxID=46223 RepID=A0A1I3MVF0_9BACL|nr:histidine--tRNA ligase [Thermoflavimicrobium dichotomicum]SFJ00951.1 histidyl-tRNA synthetase [Thermoflavimicrobium dichotomicum]
MSYRVPRGTFDILPEEVKIWHWVEKQAQEICRRYQYQEIRTPMFEHTELFVRGVGDTTDIVEKEMYTFNDRGNRSLTLRPEGTAGVVRAFVEHKMYAGPLPTKLYYFGPMFRYERPQAGRYRQFHQFGIETFGSQDPAIDAEVIALGMQFLESLGLKGVKVEINTVATPEIRARYFDKLIEYFTPFKEELAKDAQNRLYRNPMRILDSKDPRTKEIAAGAPSILDFLDEECAGYFEKVKEYLDLLEIPYVVNDRLVRGLDYYTHTAFEFVADLSGAQASTVGGGGRYNGLVQEIGGPEMPGVGFGLGIDRIILALKEQKVDIPVQDQLDCYVVTIGDKAKLYSVKLLKTLREAGFVCERDYLDRKVKGQMKAADREKARFVAILGEEELEQGNINMKCLETGEQEQISLDAIVDYLSNKIQP